VKGQEGKGCPGGGNKGKDVKGRGKREGGAGHP